MEQVSELNFRFREDADSFSFVEETASNMHRFATCTCNDATMLQDSTAITTHDGAASNIAHHAPCTGAAQEVHSTTLRSAKSHSAARTQWKPTVYLFTTGVPR